MGAPLCAARCPGRVRQMISLVDIDVSPDLRNARVKFSVLGDRQDKVYVSPEGTTFTKRSGAEAEAARLAARRQLVSFGFVTRESAFAS